MAKRKIFLYGHLAEALGDRFEFDVATAGEAIRALNANFPEQFIGLLREGSYRLIRGDGENGLALDLEHVNGFKLGKGDLHIVPVVAGAASGSSKGGGGIKAILGIALIGVAVFMSGGTLAAPLAGMGSFVVGSSGLTWGTVALFGLAMAVSGAASMLSPKEKPKEETKRDDSYSFSGPINVNEQGNPVPLIYGRVMTGGMPVSSGIDIEDIGTWAGSSGSGVPGANTIMISGTIEPVYNSVEGYA